MCESVEALGCEAVLITPGESTAATLARGGAHVAVPAVLDRRLDDGGLQELCVALGIACVGSPAAAYRATANKAICSKLLADAGVAVPEQRVVARSALYTLGISTALSRIAQELGPNVIVKPLYGHAGLGVRPVNDYNSIPHVVLSALKNDEAVVIEQAIAGMECTVLVTGKPQEPWAAGIAQVLYQNDESPSGSAWARQYVPVAPDNRLTRDEIVRTARVAARAVGAADLASVDLVLDRDGTAWVFDVDCMLDWCPDGRLAACLASNDVTATQLMASLLTDTSATVRAAA